jgi:hypothetical protein
MAIDVALQKKYRWSKARQVAEKIKRIQQEICKGTCSPPKHVKSCATLTRKLKLFQKRSP